MNTREHGFTIFEALVAFAILASVISALYAVSGTSLRLLGESDRIEQVAMLAQSKLDELATVRSPLPAAETGTFAGSDIAWRVETRDIAGSKAGPTAFHLQAVKLILSWPGSRPLVVETRHLGTAAPWIGVRGGAMAGTPSSSCWWCCCSSASSRPR